MAVFQTRKVIPCLCEMLIRTIIILYGPKINSVLGDLILDFAPGDSQKNGGFSLVSMGIFQCLFNDVSLEGAQELRQGSW